MTPARKKRAREFVGWIRRPIWDWADMCVVNRRRRRGADSLLGESIKVVVREVRRKRERSRDGE